MKKQTFDPWSWGPATNSVQAVEIKNPEGTLYCSGQVALDANGVPGNGDMKTQLIQTLQNLEQLINESGYECSGIVRLNVYTTSTQEFFTTCMDVYVPFIQKYGIKQATSLIEVKGLFAALTVELEATVVKQNDSKMQKIEIETFCPASQTEWRNWLKKNHHSKQSVWLLCYKKKSTIPTISWSTAVDEALCFGWIDSKRIPVDEEKFMQFFSRRKPNGTWSKVNKEKIKELIAKNFMTKAGLDVIEISKQNGSWTILDDVEKLKIPKDLEQEFKKKKGSKKFFLSLSKSVRKAILQWIVLAKRQETRQKRINEVAELAAQKQKPKQF